MLGFSKKIAAHVAAAALVTGALAVGGPLAADGAPRAQSDVWQRFDRASAVEFADAHYDDGPHWPLVDDCTFFASESLQAGMLPESAEWTEFSNDPAYVASEWRRRLLGAIPTKAYMNADYLKNYLVDSGLATITQIDPTQHIVPGAAPGDLIGYSWDNDGFIHHIAMVVGNTDETVVDQHEPNSLHKGWNWSSSSNDWITQSTPNVAVYLIHITW